MRVNADSVFLGCKYALPLIRESQPNSIINLSSIAGLIASHNFAFYKCIESGGGAPIEIGGPPLRSQSLGHSL